MEILDSGAVETDALLEKMEKRLNTQYNAAESEMRKKLKDFLKKYDAENKKKLAQVESGILSQEAYDKWLKNQAYRKKWMESMVDTLSRDATMTDAKAMSIVRGYLPEAYAINRNYAMFEVESGALVDTSFTLYDSHTVERIVRDRPNLLPDPSPDIPKEMRWHKQKINNAISQGILQGEAIPAIASRLQKVTDMDRRAAVRNARTATTGAQNAGRVDSYKYAQSLGIDLEQEWMATWDNRTRHSHRMLDGETAPVDGTFSNGCRYPGDPKGDPSEIYNCRCALRAVIAGHKYKDLPGNGKLGDMSYEEWKRGKLDQKQ